MAGESVKRGKLKQSKAAWGEIQEVTLKRLISLPQYYPIKRTADVFDLHMAIDADRSLINNITILFIIRRKLWMFL
jgi:hypothetical protein